MTLARPALPACYAPGEEITVDLLPKARLWRGERSLHLVKDDTAVLEILRPFRKIKTMPLLLKTERMELRSKDRILIDI